jgi:glycogen synthase
MNGDGLRVAFLTTEFVTEHKTGGGLGNYLNRITRAFRDLGHHPEIFVLSTHPPETFVHGGVVVHRVSPADSDYVLRAVGWLTHKVRADGCFYSLIRILSGSLGLAQAIRRRERETRFDLIQSADWQAPGLFVPHQRNRPHLIRCSLASDLYADCDGDRGPRRFWLKNLERAAIRRADATYAPSRFIADHLERTLKLPISVVRPPVFIESDVDNHPQLNLPKRFLMHFGQLRSRKGTDWIVRALPEAWAAEPELRMVFAGQVDPFEKAAWSESWGDLARNVVWVGPLSKPSLYAVLGRADAAVLPSIVDNLPNTVIESLMLGIPVVGSAGASIDELVEPEVTGEVVPINDVSALAAALVRVWQRRSPVRKGFIWNSSILREMQPNQAVKNLLRLAGLESGCREIAAMPR